MCAEIGPTTIPKPVSVMVTTQAMIAAGAGSAILDVAVDADEFFPVDRMARQASQNYGADFNFRKS